MTDSRLFNKMTIWFMFLFLISGISLMAQSAPTAVTGAASGVGSTDATLNGTVNANGASTTVYFEYGLDTGYGSTWPADQGPVTGSTNTAVTASLSELLPNTLYHYRVVATNANGTTYGEDMTFTTLPSPPLVITIAATAITTSAATLNGLVNAMGDSTTVTFEYGTDTSYGATVTADQSPVTGTSVTSVSKAITGLTNNTTYHFRVVGQNSGGTSYGNDMTFTTGAGAAPTVFTNAATGVGSTTATLNGTVNANNADTIVTFEYGLDTGYGSTAFAGQNPVSGSIDTAVSVTLSDLLPNTTYHYRVVATNANGSDNGVDMTFTTLPLAPTATTNAASAVTTTGATLNGTVNANNSSTTVAFQYGVTTSYGTTVTAAQSPVTGSTDTAVSRAITGLTNGVTYHYRVMATNAGGTTYGADMTFTPGTTPPTATTAAASGIGATTATLNGTVNANGSSTTVTFEYGETTAYGRTVYADQSPVTGSTNTAVSAPVASLSPNTTYHYRVVAQSVGGTTYGADMTFTTGVTAPTVTTNAASGVTTTGATLNGTVNANGSSTTVTFEYGTDTSYGATVTADQSPVTGASTTAVSKTITGLTGSTTYHYRVVGQNANGTTYGADMTFFTGTAAPTVTTGAASSIGSTSATLNGTVNANNSTTTVTFEYGVTTAYGRTAAATPGTVTGSSDTAVNSAISELLPGTTYYYRVKAVNAEGTTYGADMTFTTSGAPPSADTNAAAAVTTSGATLNGSVNANNDSTTVTFQYGLTTAYGTTVPADQSPVTGGGNTAVSVSITGLTNNTTYHYRVAAQNSSGTTYGADMTFFTGTAAPTVTTGAASGIGSTGATLNGTVNANNGSTTVTFEYGETTGYGRTATADQSPVTGSTDTAVSVNVIDLLPNTMYHFRAVGQNASGTTYGADMTFTTTPANVPTVTTANVTNIAPVSATGGGNVTDEGGAPVTARGVCWSTSPNPTTADNITSDGTGAGAFTSNLTGLTENTIYYVRAYATNLYGTAYGSEIQFTTNPANTPTVNTTNVTQITPNSARSGGNITDDGGAAVTARGVCWSTSPNPTIANNRTSDGSGTGAFTSYLTNLTQNTTYYVRAYATNSVGTAYGQQLQFTTGTPVVSVTITQPNQGDIVSGTVTIAATASTNSAQGIARVEFYIDDSLIAQDTTEPYETQWDTTIAANGSHTIKAVAYDQNDNSSQDEITVTVSNTPGLPPEIMLNRDNLNFGSVFQAGSAADSAMGSSMTTSPQTLLINNSGGGTLNWTITKDAEWLTCTPGSGVGPGVVSVSVDPAGLAVGSYSAAITVSDPANGSVTLPVHLTIYNQGTTSAPFGYFETPPDNSTVVSSIPVTGWALDDIEVTNVKIFRASLQGEGTGRVYIGDAVFVDGARPDVEAAYPDYPLNYQAGWGYMMLTNFLPNQGNGTFTLYAEATDKEGNTVTLGSKTITCDNANAEKPFGAIDTPSQGGTAAGANFINFGWALTPPPNTIPIDGSTITVWVDGFPLGSPVYNQYREDIAALFPGYNNSEGAVGYFFLDTTSYTNGVHTIAWSVQDDAGNMDGVGSRYFTIINTGSPGQTKARTAYTPNLPGRGFEGLPDEIDTPELGIKQLQHVEFQVSSHFSRIRGYQWVNDKPRPLPIGSTLDHRTGRFYWDPGAGFLGLYRLVFVIENPGGGVSEKTIEITIEAK